MMTKVGLLQGLLWLPGTRQITFTTQTAAAALHWQWTQFIANFRDDFYDRAQFCSFLFAWHTHLLSCLLQHMYLHKVASALHCWVLGWWSIALYVIQYIMMRETLNLIRKWSSATLLFLLIVLLFICIQRVSVIVHNIWRTAAVAINSRNIISWGHWH